MMKKINLIVAICLVAFTSFASNISEKETSEVGSQERYEMAVTFLKKYDDKYACHKWKIVMKDEKVICQRFGGIVSIHLYNSFFDSKKEKDGQE